MNKLIICPSFLSTTFYLAITYPKTAQPILDTSVDADQKPSTSKIYGLTRRGGDDSFLSKRQDELVRV